MITVWDPASPAAPRPPQMDSRTPLLGGKGGPRRQPLPEAVLSDSVQVAGHYVEVWNDEHFSRLRRKHGVPDNFLNADKENSVDFSKCRSESKLGKGGEKQFASSDSRYIVKSVSKDDHVSLLQRGEAYVERLLTGQSLLVPIYLHFLDPASMTVYIAMRNLTPENDYWTEKYDLKGCADDKTLVLDGRTVVPVHKRFYRADMWCSCMWTPARWTYYKGKVNARALSFNFPFDTCQEILQCVQGDAHWLGDQGLMDYSLFLAVRRFPLKQLPGWPTVKPPDNGTATDSSQVRHFAMYDRDEVTLVTLAIIDFLQPWTAAKKVAKCIKSLEFNKATIPPAAYGKRFRRHFEERFRGDSRLKPLSAAQARNGVV